MAKVQTIAPWCELTLELLTSEKLAMSRATYGLEANYEQVQEAARPRVLLCHTCNSSRGFQVHLSKTPPPSILGTPPKTSFVEPFSSLEHCFALLRDLEISNRQTGYTYFLFSQNVRIGQVEAARARLKSLKTHS